MARKGSVADITALQALNTSFYRDGDWIEVMEPLTNMAPDIYQLNKSATYTESHPGVVTPTTGTGRWIAKNARVGYGGAVPPADWPVEFEWVNAATDERSWKSQASGLWVGY